MPDMPVRCEQDGWTALCVSQVSPNPLSSVSPPTAPSLVPVRAPYASPHTLSCAFTSAPLSSSCTATSVWPIKLARINTRVYRLCFSRLLPMLLLLLACGSGGLMRHGVRCEQDGKTALMRASRSGHTEEVVQLLNIYNIQGTVVVHSQRVNFISGFV